MKTLHAALLGLALTAGPVAADAAPALWQVSDADSSVWLFGSVHVLPPDLQWRTPAFDDALAKAEQVYFEADIGPLGQLSVAIKGIKMAFAAHDPWLSRLTAEQSAKLASAIAPLGLTTAQLGAYAPWLAEAVIEDKVMQILGFDPALGVDSILQAELPKEKKAFFETASGQMDLLAADPPGQQISRLMATIEGIDQMPAEFKSLATAWSVGDIAGISSELADDPSMDQAFTQTMVLDRNARWVTTLEGLLAANHADMIVVGAGHLVGDGSVLDLLSKAGFTVMRIQ